MGIMTISMSDEVEKELREAVKKKMGNGKGVLGKAIEEAVKKWIYNDEQREIAERQIKLMEKGLYSLKGWKFNRDELYDRI